MMEQALNKHRAGDLAGAAADYRAVLNETPDNDEAHHFLGLVLLDQGNLGGALDAVEKAIELKGDVGTYYATLGSIRHAQGDPESARANLAQALELNPNLPEGHNTLGFLELTLGDFDAAEKALNTALRLDPDSSRVQVNLGQLRLAQGQLDEAVNAFQRVLSAHPDNLPARTSLGEALLRKGAFATAEEAFRSALKQRPGVVGWQVGLAQALAAQHRLAEAREVCVAAVSAAPDHAQARATAGEVALRMNHLVDAVEHYKQSLLKRPGHPATIEGLGDALWARGELEQAAQCFAAAATPGARIKALALKAEQGQGAAAREGLAALLADDPMNGAAVLTLAEVAETPAAAAQTLAAFVERAPADHPQRDVAGLALGRASLAAGRADQALAALEAVKASRLTDREAAEGRELKARALDYQGDFAEAARVFQTVTRELTVEAARLPDDATPPAAPLPDDGHEPPVVLVGLPGSGVRWLASVLGGLASIEVLDDRYAQPGERRDLLDSNAGKRLGERPAESHHRLERRAYWRAAERQWPAFEGRVLAVDAVPLAQCRLASLGAFFPGATVLVAQRHPADLLLHGRTRGWRGGLVNPELITGFYDRVLTSPGLDVIPVDVDAVLASGGLEAALTPLATRFEIGIEGLDALAAGARQAFAADHDAGGHWLNYRENLALLNPQLTALAGQLGYER